MSLNTLKEYRGGGTKQYVSNYNFMSMIAYMQLRDTIDRSYFFDGSVPLVDVGTPTKTVFRDGDTPPSIDLDNNVVSVADQNNEAIRPIATFGGKQYTRFTAVGTGDGTKFTIPATDFSAYRYVILVAKSGQASTTGLLTIRSTAGNESDCAYTTSATANIWRGGSNIGEALIFPFRDDADTAVTFTGTPDFNAITEIEVTVDTIANDVSPYEVYFVKDIRQVIGSVVKLNVPCPLSVSREITNEFEAIQCGQVDISQEPNSSSRSFTWETQLVNYSDLAYASGDVLKTDTNTFPEVTISPSKNPQQVTAGVITLPSSAPVYGDTITLYKDGRKVILSRNYRSSAAAIQNGEFHQSGATVTVPTIYNTWTAFVEQAVSQTGATYVDRPLVRGLVGPAYVPRSSRNGTIVKELFNKAELSISAVTSGNVDSVSFTLKLYPVNGEFSKSLIQ